MLNEMEYVVNKKAIAWEIHLEMKPEAIFEELKKWLRIKNFGLFVCEIIKPFSEIIYVHWTNRYDNIFEWENIPFVSISKEDFLKYESYTEYLNNSKNKSSHLFISKPEKKDNYFSNFIYNYQIKEDGAYNLATEMNPKSSYPNKIFLESINVKVNDIKDIFKVQRKILRGEPNREDPIESFSYRLPERGKSIFLGQKERYLFFPSSKGQFSAAFYTTREINASE